MILTRVLPGSLERLSATFDDGLSGSVKWSKVLEGTGLSVSRIRQETVRPSEDGSALAFDVYVKQDGQPQGPDETKQVPAAKVHALMAESEHFKMVFEVDGQYGPMTLAFTYLGKDKNCQVDGEECRELSKREVQWWYTHRGWPRAGILISMDWRGRPKSAWQLV